LLVFFGLFASGQVKMRRIEGWCDLGETAALAAWKKLMALQEKMRYLIFHRIRDTTQVTNSMILGRVLVLTRFEQKTTTVLLQLSSHKFGGAKGRPMSERIQSASCKFPQRTEAPQSLLAARLTHTSRQKTVGGKATAKPAPESAPRPSEPVSAFEGTACIA
jgi:hypothetical protein